MRSGGACSPAGATRGADAFGSYHPALVFTFFACAIVLGMFVRNPAFLAVTVVFSGLYYAVLAGRRSLRMLAGMVALFIAIAVLNPLFNTRGDVVLFTYFDRPYTLEALAYGAQTAALLVGMLLWFSCYNIVMTSDKFTYLFGRMAPSVTLVFTMVLRLIPAYRRKIDELAAARSGIGRSLSVGTLSERVGGASAILSALTSWALEGGMSTADSMRSRGFGQARRTAYARYRFTARDGALLACMALLAAISVGAIAGGFASADFASLAIAPASGPISAGAGAAPDPISLMIRSIPDPISACGLVAYSAFMALPSAITIGERLLWHISLSNS